MIANISYDTSNGTHDVVYQWTVGDQTKEVRLPHKSERCAKAVLQALESDWGIGDTRGYLET
jgi:hypothetical protein